ncbi:hypothetical protein N566_24525, partial [Streptomycetaceae bacterium MP113-05]
SGRWMNLGQYNAHGMRGADALGVGIERMVTGVTSGADTDRGIAARLRYLTASGAGYAAMERAGISVTPRTMFAWLAEERSPSPANRARLDAAYWDLRRHNVATDLKRRLTSRGGTRIEIDPVDQTAVDRRHRRDLTTRRLTVRPHHWEAAVEAWLTDDDQALDTVWDDIITGIGSDYDSYTYISSIGWSA